MSCCPFEPFVFVYLFNLDRVDRKKKKVCLFFVSISNTWCSSIASKSQTSLSYYFFNCIVRGPSIKNIRFPTTFDLSTWHLLYIPFSPIVMTMRNPISVKLPSSQKRITIMDAPSRTVWFFSFVWFHHFDIKVLNFDTIWWYTMHHITVSRNSSDYSIDLMGPRNSSIFRGVYSHPWVFVEFW